MYTVCEVKDRKGELSPTDFIVSTDTLTDARKKAYEIVWKEHMRKGADRPIKKGVFKAGEKVKKVTWCPKCKKILWNDGKEWYALMKNGRLGKKVY